MVIWITGLTASGKTTLGRMLENKLINNGYKKSILLDGDVLRKKEKFSEGHTLQARAINFEILINLISNELKNNKIVIVSTVSHLEYMRKQARKKFSNFVEIFLECDPSICEQRDFKNLYRRAKSRSLIEGEIFPGVTEPYQKSKKPDLIINTEIEDVDKSFNKLYKFCDKLIQDNYGKL